MEDQERQDLTRHLFAVVTAMLEDAATMAAEGQTPLSDQAHRNLAETVEAVSMQAVSILRAISSLLPIKQS